uniref:Secreted protein n=1 Tax=Oryza meridionalis TaxID=40149 RepID=A0A0E0DSJ9_9ORYZ
MPFRLLASLLLLLPPLSPSSLPPLSLLCFPRSAVPEALRRRRGRHGVDGLPHLPSPPRPSLLTPSRPPRALARPASVSARIEFEFVWREIEGVLGEPPCPTLAR